MLALAASLALLAQDPVASPTREPSLHRSSVVARPADTGLPYQNQLHPMGPVGTYHLRVVDGRTGLPLPEASVARSHERLLPERGEFWSDEVAEANAWGFVTLHGDGLLYTSAPGFGVTTVAGPRARGPVLRVLPGVDVPLLVQDAWGSPQVGAGIGYALFCGHSPDVRFAVSGADGIAWLRDVEPTQEFGAGFHSLWPLASGLSGDEENLRWRPGDGPVVLRPDRVPDIVGRVVDTEGVPAAGVTVCQRARHRGPVTTTDADGRYRLVSPIDRGSIMLFQGQELINDWSLPLRTPITLRLPRVWCENDPLEEATLTITIRDADTGEPVSGVAFDASPLVSAGWWSGLDGVSDAEGRVRLRVPVGESVIWTDPHRQAGADYEYLERIVEVPKEGAALDLELVPYPKVRVRLGKTLRESGLDWSASVVLPQGRVRVKDRLLRGEPIPIPARGERLVSLWCDGATWLRPIPDEGELTLDLPIATGRFVDEDGRPHSGAVALGEYSRADHPTSLGPGGDFEVPVTGTGAVFLVLERSSGQRRCIDWTLPEPDAEGNFDLGTLRIPTELPLQVPLAAESYARLLRPALATSRRLDEQGRWIGFEPREGDHLVVEARSGEGFGRVHMRWTLAGEGPWTFAPEDRRVTLRFVDKQGQPVPGLHLYYRDQHWHCEGSRFELRGLTSGSHHLVFGNGVVGHWEARLAVPAAPDQEIEVVLGR